MTKVTYRNCSKCGREMSLMITDDSIVIAIRCPDCNDKMQKIMIGEQV